MTTRGTVRHYSLDEGWGVIDSPATPGGCWVHFSAIEGDGLRSLAPGEDVEFEAEAAEQDGFSYRAVRVRRPGVEPQVREPDPASDAFRSTMRLTLDDD